jgi:hypothetical protein
LNTNESRTDQLTNKPTKQTNKQTSKQASKQPNKQPIKTNKQTNKQNKQTNKERKKKRKKHTWFACVARIPDQSSARRCDGRCRHTPCTFARHLGHRRQYHDSADTGFDAFAESTT